MQGNPSSIGSFYPECNLFFLFENAVNLKLFIILANDINRNKFCTGRIIDDGCAKFCHTCYIFMRLSALF